MSIKSVLRKVVRKFADVPGLGRIVRVSIAVWRTPYTRELLGQTNTLAINTLHEVGQAQDRLGNLERDANAINVTMSELSKKIDELANGYGTAIRGMEKCLIRHEKQFANLQSSLVAEIGEAIKRPSEKVSEIEEKVKWLNVDNDNIRSRLEFIRVETLFELRKQIGKKSTQVREQSDQLESKIVNVEKVANSKPLRLNLGCGHIAKDGYINVDSRELPGVDIIADVANLPFENGSVDSIFAAHLIEHFSERAIKDFILPHWSDVLKEGGGLTVIAPDTVAMLNAYVNGDFTFDQLREVIFGGQEYDGDFHFTMFSTDSLKKILSEFGFSNIKVIASNRRNGACLEFEISAVKDRNTTQLVA